MTQDRIKLAQLIKNWAQEHNVNYVINDPDPSDQGITNTAAYLSWLIRESDDNLDLISLLNSLEDFVKNIRKRKFPDGMFCKKCQNFYEFAESNQDDGTLLCYSCRHSCG